MNALDAADLVFPKSGHQTLKGLKEAYLKELLRETLLVAANIRHPDESRGPGPRGSLDSGFRPLSNGSGSGTSSPMLGRRNDGWNVTPSLYELLAGALKTNPKALLEILSSPEIAPAVWCFKRQKDFPGFEERIARAVEALPGSLLISLAARNLLPPGGVSWEIGTVPISLISHSLGFSLTLESGSGWHFENGRVSALGDARFKGGVNLNSETLLGRRPAAAGISSELCYVTLKHPHLIKLALKDFNPIAEAEAHPDKSGNALDLGGHSEEDWRASLAQCLDWTQDLWPELFEEMEILLKSIVPVGYSGTKHLSASYREAVGTIYMTLHPHLLTMTEALIHEFQHNKMNLASYFDAFLENAFFPLYKSPVRPDPRPLWGVLLAVHAFLPVAEFYRKMRAAGHPVSKSPDFDKRLAEIDEKNREGMATLREHAQWTLAGRKLMDELEAVEERHKGDLVIKFRPVRP